MLQTSPPQLQRIYRKTLDRYDFRIATEADVDGMVALWPEHWAEAHYPDRGIEPDETRYRAWMTDMLHYGLGVWIVAVERSNNRIVGFFAYTLDNNFCVKPVAVMGTFFVAKAHRRTAVPVLLFDFAIGMAKGDGACAFHAPITSETQSSRALENTFRKAGFGVIGTMMGKAL